MIVLKPTPKALLQNKVTLNEAKNNIDTVGEGVEKMVSSVKDDLTYHESPTAQKTLFPKKPKIRHFF